MECKETQESQEKAKTQYKKKKKNQKKIKDIKDEIAIQRKKQLELHKLNTHYRNFKIQLEELTID